VIQPIEVLKDLDGCSPQFFLDTATGTPIKEATITFVRLNRIGQNEQYFQIKLTDIQITGVESMTVSKGETTLQDAGAVEVNQVPDGVQEVVTLAFRKIQLIDLISKKTVTFGS
jgi:type VI secretion system Hcp family effector